jgi:hypothetical protein
MARSQLWTPPVSGSWYEGSARRVKTWQTMIRIGGGGQLKIPNIGVATKNIRAPDHPSWDDTRVFYIHPPPPPHPWNHTCSWSPALSSYLLLCTGASLYAPRVFWAPNGTRLSAQCHFTGPKKLSNSRAQPPPTSPRNGYARIQNIMHGAVYIMGA